MVRRSAWLWVVCSLDEVLSVLHKHLHDLGAELGALDGKQQEITHEVGHSAQR